MQFFKRTFGGLIAVFILVAVILFIRAPKLFTEPNTWLIGDTYDGFRSYSAMVYHVKHDSTYMHNVGMNYPYGDKNAFTDNLPLLTNSVKFISENISDLSDYCGGILNGFLMLSVILCAVFVFLSFRSLDLPVWYAVPVAIGITLLSPQLLRLEAHYGLAHPFVIPLTFWLSLLFHKKKSWGLSILIAFVLFLFAQIHFYLFAISGAFIIALMAFKTLFAFNKKALVINALHLTIQVVLPLVLLQLSLSDDLPDRPTKPFGFFTYKARWESVFIPVDFQIGRWIDEYLYKIPGFDREGIAYIGLVAVLFFIKEFFQKIGYRLFSKPYHTIRPEPHRFFLKAAFWASALILAFSFCLPFVLPGFKELPNKIGLLAQFRSLGRFAWVFFYVINVIAFYALYFQIKKLKKQGWQAIIYTLLIVVLLVESGVFLFDKVDLKLEPNPEIRTKYQQSDNTWLDSIKVEDYQAILNVPFFHIGSENIWISPTGKNVHRALWLSVQTGLPINSSFMGRTSVGHVINQLELIAEPYRKPQILDDFINEKDFLVQVYKPGYQQTKSQYARFLEGLPLIHEDEEIKIYRLSLKKLEARIKEKETATRRAFKKDRLFKYDTYYSTDSLRRSVYLNFDEQTAAKTYRGSGAFERCGFPENILYDGHIPFQENDTSYVFSVWIYMWGDLNPKLNVSIEEYQAGTTYAFYRRNYEPYKFFKAIDHGWVLCEFPFKLGRQDSRLRIKAWNKDRGTNPIFLDELQIRREGTRIYTEQEGWWMLDNRWWRER